MKLLVENKYDCRTSSIKLSNSLSFGNMSKFINVDCVSVLLAPKINVELSVNLGKF